MDRPKGTRMVLGPDGKWSTTTAAAVSGDVVPITRPRRTTPRGRTTTPPAAIDPDDELTPGPIETQARVDIGGLGALAGLERTIAETIYAAARYLDHGAGLATAGVSKEIRTGIDQLIKSIDARSDSGDPDLDDMDTPG